MDRLVALFNSSDADTAAWVRIPVINYLRACPLPEAKRYIEQLRKIDANAVQQSETLYAVGPDPTPSVRTQRADSKNAAAASPVDNLSVSTAAPAAILPGAVPEKSSTSSERTLPISGLIVVLAAVIGAVVLAAVARGGPRKSSAVPANE